MDTSSASHERSKSSGAVPWSRSRSVDPLAIDVLVVEDDGLVRQTMTEVLDDAGYAVATAENGQDALDLIDAGLEPRLILLDLRMPVMDGWEFLRLQGEHANAVDSAVVLVSAESELPSDDPAVAGQIAKPVDIDELLTVVRRQCP